MQFQLVYSCYMLLCYGETDAPKCDIFFVYVVDKISTVGELQITDSNALK